MNQRTPIDLTEDERQELQRIKRHAAARRDRETEVRAGIVLMADGRNDSLSDIARKWYVGEPDKRYVSKVLRKFASDRIDSVNGKRKGRPLGTLNGQVAIVEVMAEIELLHENEPEATPARFKEHLDDHFGRSFGASTVRRYLSKAGIRFRKAKT